MVEHATTTEEPTEGQQPASAATEDRYDKPKDSRVSIGTLNTRGSKLIFAGGDEPEEPELVSGKIGVEEVLRSLQGHVIRSLNGDVEARLASSFCVILTAAPGSGRRTAALHALVERVSDQGLVEIGLYDVHDLDKFRFEPARGYLLDASPTPAPTAHFTSATLRSVQSKLRQQGAYLVVIGLNSTEWSRVDDEFVVPWTPPSLAELLEAREFSPPIDAEDENLWAALGESPSVAQITDVLDRLEEGRARGATDDEVLSELPEREREAIRQWFIEPQSLTSWALMSGLVFLSSTAKAEFDHHHEHLVTMLEQKIPSSDEDAELLRDDLTRSAPVELENCQAEVRHRSHDIEEDVTVGRQLVCFKKEHATTIFLEEYWRAVPRRLQKVVISWLADIWDELGDEAATLLAHRVGSLIATDADLGLSILDHWASTYDAKANRLAALTVDGMATDATTRALAFAIAREWSKLINQIPKQYCALYAYTGKVGVFQVRQAIRIYRFQWRRRPFWATGTWAGFTEACADNPSTADELASAMARVGVVRKGEIDDPAFHLVDRWFVDSPSEVPLALRLAESPTARTKIALIAACTLQRSYRHERWLESIIPWADAEDPAVAHTAVLLLRACLRAITVPQQTPPRRDPIDLPDRVRSVADGLERYMRRARRRSDGPSPLAVERCTAVIVDVLGQLERRPELDE
ncbi:MAG: hypothetical protein GY939_24960 [Actinomycetia bacterium]|nr:hypothetical protein [Actinomycetes bacterium]